MLEEKEEEMEMVDDEGEASSDDDVLAVSAAAKKGAVGMFTWSCPRSYPAKLEDRRKMGCLKPADMGKTELAALFKKVLTKRGLIASLEMIAIANEPHARYEKIASNPDGVRRRERHYHVVVAFKTPFTHAMACKDLAAAGVNGWFSFNLVGKASYLAYVLNESSKKPRKDLDEDLFFFPKISMQQAQMLVNLAPAQQRARKGNVLSNLPAAVPRKENLKKQRTT